MSEILAADAELNVISRRTVQISDVKIQKRWHNIV